MDLEDIFPPEDQWRREAEMRYCMQEQNIFDDMLAEIVEPIKVGDRVKCIDTDGAGTIIHIALTSSPFRVKWDDGDYTDWFRGNQLEKIN